MIKISARETVRNLKFHVKITDPDLLGEAIKDVASQRASGKIDPSGRGFRSPDEDRYTATVYSSTGILTEVQDVPSGDFIYTMENVAFESELVTRKGETGIEEKEFTVTMTGGWIWNGREYVLVIYTPLYQDKKKMSKDTLYKYDFPKLQGRFFYNDIFTRYVTSAIGEEILERRGFKDRELVGDDLSLQGKMDEVSPALLDLRGAQMEGTSSDVPSGGRDFDEEAGISGPVSEGEDYVKNNYFLYDKATAQTNFTYNNPDPKAPPVPPAQKPKISFNFNFPDHVSDEAPNRENSYAIDDTMSPGTVSVNFQNIPKNMPGEIWKSIYDYMKTGLSSRELDTGSNLTFGKTVYNENPEEREPLFDQYKNRVKEILSEIENLFKDNESYRVDFDKNMPSPWRGRGMRKNLIKYIKELEAYVRHLKKNLPLSLADIERVIEEQGEAAINPKNINLLKLIKKEE